MFQTLDPNRDVRKRAMWRPTVFNGGRASWIGLVPDSFREPVDSSGRTRLIRRMGTLRSPHEATCPSIASRLLNEGAIMSSPTSISVDKLARLIGTAHGPALI